jgi:hypothetical protein
MSERLLDSRLIIFLNRRCTGCIAFAVPLRAPRIRIPSVSSQPSGRTSGGIRTPTSASSCGATIPVPLTRDHLQHLGDVLAGPKRGLDVTFGGPGAFGSDLHHLLWRDVSDLICQLADHHLVDFGLQLLGRDDAALVFGAQLGLGLLGFLTYGLELLLRPDWVSTAAKHPITVRHELDETKIVPLVSELHDQHDVVVVDTAGDGATAQADREV